LIFAVDIVGTSEGTTEIPTTVHFQVDNAGTLMTDLQSYWKMDESSGSNRLDTIGGITLLDTNSVPTGTGKVNDAAFPSGGGDRLIVGSPTPFTNLFGEFSMAFWINPQTSAYMPIFNKKWNTAATEPGYYLFRLAAGGGRVLLFTMHNSAGGQLQVATSFSYPLTESVWHLVIITWDGTWNASNVHFYIDNNLADSGASTSGALSSMSNPYPFEIGRDVQDTSLDTDGAFGIDEFGIWSKVLTLQERVDLWDAGTGQTIVPN
jgi:hypothetical protein